VCLIAFALDAHPRWRLVLAANRDEFLARPSAAASWWRDEPTVYGGRDLQAGGTWFGLTRGGLAAAVTNVREGAPPRDGRRSRGELAAGFLLGARDAGDPLRDYAQRIDPADYAGFNLLLLRLGPPPSARWLSNRAAHGREGQALGPGVHALSNHLLDTPWPKVTALREALGDALDAGPAAAIEARLFDALADRTLPPDDALPRTGIGLERERQLAPAFIAGPGYGTRTSTVVTVDRDGVAQMAERTWLDVESPAARWTERRTRFGIAG
jgi:uncharacterized protein with NRDE domain